MLKAGLPLSQSLTMIGRDMEKGEIPKILEDLGRTVEEGETLSGAVGRHPRLHHDEALTVLRSGERSGELPAALEEIARYADRIHGFNERVKAILAYPLFLLFTAALLSAFLSVGARSLNLKELSREAGVGFSWPAKIFQILTFNPWIYLGALAVIVFLLVFFRKEIASFLGRKIPFFSGFLIANEKARFLRTASLCLKAGMPLPEALEAALPSVADKGFQSGIRKAISSVREGGAVGESLEGERAFPQSVLWVLKQAERHGELPACLEHLADAFDARAEISGRVILALFEPVAIALVGVLVALLVYALMSPMFGLMMKIHG
jgi:type IV pilus assembly protein PilC